MAKKFLSWGENIWENKITKQGEVGVIFGPGFSKTQIDSQTSYAMKRFSEELLPLIEHKGNVLDVGVGPMARYSIEFAKKGYQVVGIDVSKKVLQHATRYIKRHNLQTIKLKQADMTSFVDRKKYNLIFCIETFYHVPKHLGFLTLRNFNKMLSTNGYALVGFHVVGNERKLKDIFFELLYSLLLKFAKKIFIRKIFSPHIARYSEDELNDILARTGFKLQKKLNYNKYFLNNLWLLKKERDISKV